MANLKHKGGQKGRTIELSGLILTSLERVYFRGGLVNSLVAWLAIEGIKPLLVATGLSSFLRKVESD